MVIIFEIFLSVHFLENVSREPTVTSINFTTKCLISFIVFQYPDINSAENVRSEMVKSIA